MRKLSLIIVAISLLVAMGGGIATASPDPYSILAYDTYVLEGVGALYKLPGFAAGDFTVTVKSPAEFAAMSAAEIAAFDVVYVGWNPGYAGDIYNNSGDTIIISPPLPWPGPATPKTSSDLADEAFWDSP